MKPEQRCIPPLRPALAGLAVMMLAACATTADQTLSPSTDTAGGWQVMDHIKLAAFSAGDPREYGLMIFCDAPDHVRIYHLAPLEALGDASDLVLRSGAVRVALEGQREEVRAPPPPVSADPGPLLGVRVHARIARTAPVMAAFLQSGRLEAVSGQHVTHADAGEAERAMLAAFFGAACQ